MVIEITIKDKSVKVSVRDGKKVVSKAVFSDERNLGTKIIPTVDKMLRESRITVKNIEKVIVDSDQSDSFTTTRIAKSFANSWNWANKYADK